MIFLRQNTASQEALLGPFQDDTDFKTAEVALTIANTDIKLIKAGATGETNKNSGGGTHVAGGYYSVVFDATDSNTLGSGVIRCKMAGALEVWVYYTVLSAGVYDAWFGSVLQPVDVTSFGGMLLTARRVPLLCIADQGTAASISGATLNVQTGHGYGDNVLNGCIVAVTGSTAGNYPQWRVVTGHTGDAFTLNAAPTVPPTGTVTYIIFGIPASNLDAAVATIALLQGMIQDGNKFTATALSLAPNASGQALFTGTASTGSINSLTCAALSQADADYWRGRLLVSTSGTTAGQCAVVTGFDKDARTLTFFPPMTQAISTNTFELHRWAPAYSPSTIGTLSELDTAQDAQHALTQGKVDVIDDYVDTEIAQILAAVDTEIAALVAQVGQIWAAVDTEVAAIKAKTDALPADTNGALNTLLTNLAAVKAQSDKLTFDGSLLRTRLDKVLTHALQDNGVGGKNIGATV